MKRRVARHYLVFLPLLVWVSGLAAAAGAPQGYERNEQRREQDQRMADIFKAMDVKPGAVVADVGAGRGFYTVRLSRAVGDEGRVFAVDVNARTLRQLRDLVEEDGLANVAVVEGAYDDPRLPGGALDAALIVNAYHEMTEHQAMLAHLRTALKPGGRLVIVEPISASRRTASRAEQTRQHEIAPDLVQEDARAAGFRVLTIEDPFANYRNSYYMLVLTPDAAAAGTARGGLWPVRFAPAARDRP